MKNILAITLLLFASSGFAQTPVFYAIPTDRRDVTMNIVVMDPEAPLDKVLLVVPGTPGQEGRIMLRGKQSPSLGALQYLYPHLAMFKDGGIALVSMGCPTDQWETSVQCYDDYRSSQQYVGDVKKVIEFLREKYAFKEFYLFGHSSGGISSRWLSLRMPDQFKGVINSSVMNDAYGDLARSTIGFDMNAIKIPVLNIAHEDDRCPSTPYSMVKNYSKDNLVTVRGGGQTGHICGRANRHSFEGRQKGVAKAIVKWITTGEVQKYVDDDGQ